VRPHISAKACARLELIEGEIIELAPIGYGHAACVRRMTSLFSRLLGERVQVSVQNPIDLDERTQPQPDLVLLRPRDDYFSNAHPTATDILLLIEVAETSGDYDRQIKVPLYARHGIDEVWLVACGPAPAAFDCLSRSRSR
jgi:Uma2 family endonuclease